MDKIFRYVLPSVWGAVAGSTRDALTCRKRTARKQKQAKQAIPPLPALPPSLNVDIRNSLILPGCVNAAGPLPQCIDSVG